MRTLRFDRSKALTVPRLAVLLVALVAAGTVLVSTAGAAVAPVNTVVPTVAGTLVVGSTLTAAPGTWSGDAPITFTYQWQRCDSPATTCADIAGAGSPTYVLAPLDGGGTVRVAVTGTNATGSQTAYSAVTAAVANAAGAPTGTAVPAISGTLVSGSTLTATTGTWAGTQPMTFSFQWLRCTAAGTTCVAVAAATGMTYQLAAADIGSTIATDVKSLNASGNTTARSAVSAAVTAVAPVATAPASAALPAIGGSAVEGMTLAGTIGTWTGTPLITFTNAWRRCDAAGATCQTIAGATGLTYVVSHDDIGHTLRFEIGAVNTAGSATATSLQTAVVTAATPTVGGPTSKQQCKHGGWWTFTSPSFRNQGQCVRSIVAQSLGKGHHGHGDGDNANNDNNGRSGKSHGNSAFGLSQSLLQRNGKEHGKSHGRHGGNGGGDD
jgi:hypothetical protein